LTSQLISTAAIPSVLFCCIAQAFGVSPEWLVQLFKADPQLISLANLPAKVNFIAQAMQWDPAELVAQLVVSNGLQHVLLLFLPSCALPSTGVVSRLVLFSATEPHSHASWLYCCFLTCCLITDLHMMLLCLQRSNMRVLMYNPALVVSYMQLITKLVSQSSHWRSGGKGRKSDAFKAAVAARQEAAAAAATGDSDALQHHEDSRSSSSSSSSEGLEAGQHSHRQPCWQVFFARSISGRLLLRLEYLLATGRQEEVSSCLVHCTVLSSCTAYCIILQHQQPHCFL
jgi:hypothetical protein